MDPTSINRLFRAGKLKRGAFGPNVFRPGKPLHIARNLDAEILEGRHEGRARKGSGGGSSSLASKLQKRIGKSSALAKRTLSRGAGKGAFDARQRAIVKIHYFGHGGGGAKGLREHIRYIGRDSAVRPPELPPREAEQGGDERAKAEAHKRAEERAAKPERYVFYDATSDSVNGAARGWEWGREDRRHFRIILSPENGSRLGDMRDYTRDVMGRAEAALGTKLEWIAVDHHDTDNAHTHIVIRGRHEDGRELFIPRDYIQHGFRSAARDAATERLGQRTRDDERLALSREVRAHRPTRLDALIADQLPADGIVRLAHLRAASPDLTDAIKGRAQELRRLGLATEVERNVLCFEPGWRDGLKAMEMHLDIRKALLQARAQEAARAAFKGLSLGPGPDL